MSSESSLLTTAASDTSSSAESRYYCNGAWMAITIPPQLSSPPVQPSPAQSSPKESSRRRSYNLKARGVVIAKDVTPNGGNQKVFCVCKICKGKRIVSKSTCYRHLRIEAEIEEAEMKWKAKWGPYMTPAHEEALRTQGLVQLQAFH